MADKIEVKFDNGVTKFFNSRIKTLHETEVTDDSIIIKFYLANGKIVEFVREINPESEAAKRFNAQVMARGFLDMAKANTLECVLDKVQETDITVEEALLEKFAEFNANELSTRKTGLGTRVPLSLLELAYARKYDIDPNTPEGYEYLINWSRSLTKEEKVALKQAGKKGQKPGELYLEYLKLQAEAKMAIVAASQM